ncbi:hypothetical protein SARC_02693 [Sphaeroforma arctica JP610]|uniref:Uncharacterized protein n=1 Tax=Sphaeroforma arctica JP610 TaxID=667725 RepID=A0A0L0GA42_9EUKA|nr:hypothetical protein SARC_02693 [Sphaeroforma arctica JP610]KNC85103.1 hypothetical protein SARC_02693 [Sphaeroforma arctica JP610]|eukprot:XP_014159005.1 hypothetical protein SARC_02693 [Sphaeroforma arctica JP610]
MGQESCIFQIAASLEGPDKGLPYYRIVRLREFAGIVPRTTVMMAYRDLEEIQGAYVYQEATNRLPLGAKAYLEEPTPQMSALELRTELSRAQAKTKELTKTIENKDAQAAEGASLTDEQKAARAAQRAKEQAGKKKRERKEKGRGAEKTRA